MKWRYQGIPPYLPGGGKVEHDAGWSSNHPGFFGVKELI